MSAAAAALKKLQLSKAEEVLTAADRERRKAWKPSVGELVRLTKAGGSSGKVQLRLTLVTCHVMSCCACVCWSLQPVCPLICYLLSSSNLVTTCRLWQGEAAVDIGHTSCCACVCWLLQPVCPLIGFQAQGDLDLYTPMGFDLTIRHNSCEVDMAYITHEFNNVGNNSQHNREPGLGECGASSPGIPHVSCIC